MENRTKNYKLEKLENTGRETLNEKLVLTGAEISVNELPAGVSVPFVHAHKENEEVYFILDGKGQLYIDSEEIYVEKGNVIRIDPVGQRCFKAADNSSLKFICIQTKANSISQFTENDAIIDDSIKASWLN